METRRILMRSLAVAVVIASVIWTTTAEDQKPAKQCCTKVSATVVTDPIIGFKYQRESLPCVKAIIFETERGDFCSDPKQRWVWEKVKQFLKKNKPAPQAPAAISD